MGDLLQLFPVAGKKSWWESVEVGSLYRLGWRIKFF